MNAPFFLKSTADLKNTFFEESLVFIAEINEKGATGFVINKPFSRRLNELAEFSSSKAFALYDGGPVDREHLFILHRRPDLITGGKSIGDGLYLGGSMPDIITAIDNDELTIEDVRLFIGYCGWDNNELQNEIAEGSWEEVSGEKLL